MYSLIFSKKFHFHMSNDILYTHYTAHGTAFHRFCMFCNCQQAGVSHLQSAWTDAVCLVEKCLAGKIFV
jgi:hypothetical protein